MVQALPISSLQGHWTPHQHNLQDKETPEDHWVGFEEAPGDHRMVLKEMVRLGGTGHLQSGYWRHLSEEEKGSVSPTPPSTPHLTSHHHCYTSSIMCPGITVQQHPVV